MQVKLCCLILVAKTLANHWKWLGRSLGVSETTINAILKENIESQDEQSYQVLDKWLTTNGSKATVNIPMKALETVGVADALGDEFWMNLILRNNRPVSVSSINDERYSIHRNVNQFLQ